MTLQTLFLWAFLSSVTTLTVISIYGDVMRDQETKRLFAEVSSVVDQYRVANCSALPATITVGQVFTSRQITAPVGTEAWNVTFSKGWASLTIDTFDAEQRKSLLGKHRGKLDGNNVIVTVPFKSYNQSNVTNLSDRKLMETSEESGNYSYVCY